MNLALFDFDGTITTHETMPGFMQRAVPPLRRALGIPVFAPMLDGYKLGLVAGATIRHTVTAFGFRSMPIAHVRTAGECLTGRYRRAQCVGEEKTRRVRERLELAACDQCHAYGDTHEDGAMLALAQRWFYRGQEMA